MRCSTIHAFFETAAGCPERPALKRRLAPGRWAEMSWSQYATEVRRVGRALIALGVQAGDRVAICGPNVPEWLLANLGTLAAGAVPAPYYPTLTTEQSAYVVEHSEAILAVAHDAGQLAKLDAAKERLPRMRTTLIATDSSAPATSVGLQPAGRSL